MMIFFGLYFSRVIGTKVLPNEPVPPVIRIDELLSIADLPIFKVFDSVVLATFCLIQDSRKATISFDAYLDVIAMFFE